jgi:hypothetical protein
MSRDGKKTGGRKAGTPNKTTALNKSIITQMLAQYNDSGLMSSDFLSLDAKDRITIAERLMQYVMPKIQAVDMNVAAEVKERTIEDKLIALSQSPKK